MLVAVLNICSASDLDEGSILLDSILCVKVADLGFQDFLKNVIHVSCGHARRH